MSAPPQIATVSLLPRFIARKYLCHGKQLTFVIPRICTCMENAELIRKMRGRVEQCRRLARSTTDEHTCTILLQMADEGEADIQRLLTESSPA